MSSMNFTCDVCGREVFSCTFVNGMKFCAKCYQETFGETDKDKTIADLETKLAESEKQIKDAREAGNMAVDSWCKNRRKYEAQIAEMQNKSFILYSMLYETLEKQGCENVASQIDQMTGWTYDKEADWLKGNRNYDQLKQQLAKKEEEYQSFKKIADENVNYLKNRILEETKNYNQNKISFTIDELEKVKELLNTDFESIISWIDPYEDGECLTSMTYNHNNTIKIIDNQIKQLKGDEIG